MLPSYQLKFFWRISPTILFYDHFDRYVKISFKVFSKSSACSMDTLFRWIVLSPEGSTVQIYNAPSLTCNVIHQSLVIHHHFRHKNPIRIGPHPFYSTEAVLNRFQLSISSTYLDYEHHPWPNQAVTCTYQNIYSLYFSC